MTIYRAMKNPMSLIMFFCFDPNLRFSVSAKSAKSALNLAGHVAGAADPFQLLPT